MIDYKNNKPFVEGVSIEDIAKTKKTPFYIYSQSKISNTYKRLDNIFKSEIFYAVKANSNQAIIKLMSNLGAGADVVSVGELERAIQAGLNPKKIIFEGIGKTKNDIAYSIEKKIRLINIESLDLDNLYIEDLNFITSMENLKYLRLQANELTRSLKKRVFDTEGQIAKLKMKILSS